MSLLSQLVIATGATCPSPAEVSGNSVQEMIRGWKDTIEKFKRATHVLIVGGGPVGIEFAGEIAAYHQHAKVLSSCM